MKKYDNGNYRRELSKHMHQVAADDILSEARKKKEPPVTKNYDKSLQDKYIKLYVNSCSFDENYNIIEGIILDFTNPDSYEYNYFQAIKRAKTVSNYAFEEGVASSKKQISALPDKYKTLDEITDEATKEIYHNYLSNNITIDGNIQKDIKKEIKRRYVGNEDSVIYRKFFEAGYMHNEIMKKLDKDSNRKVK